MFWTIRGRRSQRTHQPAAAEEDLRSFWQQSLDRLAEYLSKLTNPNNPERRSSNHKEN